MNLCGVDVGPTRPCRFVAELSNNHNGSLDRALRLMTAAKQAGVDLVKIQSYTPDELVALRGDGPAPEPWGAQGWTMRALYEKAQTPLAWLPALFNHAEAIGLPIFSSVFGPESLAALEAVGCQAYKLASLDYRVRSLYDAVRATRKPMVRSAPTVFAPFKDGDDQVLLYCPKGYPQPRINLRSVQLGYDGLSYHGVNPDVCLLAAGFGARLIEFHLELDDEPSELESNVSLTNGQVDLMITRARRLQGVVL